MRVRRALCVRLSCVAARLDYDVVAIVVRLSVWLSCGVSTFAYGLCARVVRICVVLMRFCDVRLCCACGRHALVCAVALRCCGVVPMMCVRLPCVVFVWLSCVCVECACDMIAIVVRCLLRGYPVIVWRVPTICARSPCDCVCGVHVHV